MCGIAGFHLKREGIVKRHDHMELFANLLLTGIENRGRQATGFVATQFNGKQLVVDKRPLTAKEFVDGRKALPPNTQTFVGHTRFKTKGDNNVHGNLHPVSYATCFATHNGSIYNDDALFDEHQLTRYAQVDTEIIPALITRYGWKDAAKALSELQGSFAIAAIDVHQPGQVLLAKGDFSPLCYHENDNFVVWASTKFAIRDAWKEVLGTPPEFKNIQELKEGEILWLNGRDSEKLTFERAARPFQGTGKGKGRGSDSSAGGAGTGTNTNIRSIFERRTSGKGSGSKNSGRVSSTSYRGVVPNRAADVKTLRDDGNSKVVLHGQLLHDELLKIAKGAIIFISCSGCQGLVLKDHFVTRAGEGSICLDCDYVAKWGKGSAKLVVDDGTRNQLNSWAAREAVAHRDALKEVEKQTLLDVDAIDYLVFRAPPSYLDRHPTMADLADKLDDLYSEAYTAAFDVLLDSENEKNKGSEDTKPWATQPRPVQHPLLRASQCPDCSKFVAEGKPCVWCEAKKRADAEDKRIDLSKCWCGEDASNVVGGAAAFCEYHFTLCNFDPCDAGRNSEGRPGFTAYANHTLTDGKRVCHYHARSKKGAYSDTILKAKGVQFRQIEAVREPGGL